MNVKYVLPGLLICLLIFSPSYGEDIYENQLNQGIKSADIYAVQLIAQAGQDKEKAYDLLARAVHVAPTLPRVYFEASKNRFAFSGDGMLKSVDYLLAGVNAYSKNFWWSFVVLEALFFSLVFSLVGTVIIIILLRLPADTPLISHDMAESPWKTVLLFLLILLSAVSPLFFLAGILILLGLYMRKTDRIAVYLFLFFLVLSPLIFKTASLFVNASISGKGKAVVQVNESRGNTYALAALSKEGDYPARFSYALALKREGYYQAAADIFGQLVQVQQDPRAYVNLGNCFIGLNDTVRATQYYTQALNISPSASAYYNLSQISRDLLEFNQGEEYFMAAVALDRVAVSGYRAVYTRHPNRLVADETLSRSELWGYIREQGKRNFSFNLSLVPLPLLSLIAAGLAAGFFLLCKYLRHVAYRCRKCSSIHCTKCEKHIMWGQMCPQCYGSLVKLEETDVKERVSRLLNIYEKQNRRRGIMRIFSYILPGAAFIYSGRVLIGMLVLWPFLFFLMVPVMNRIMTMADPVMTHGFLDVSSLFIAFVIYGFAYGTTKRRIARGWL